MKRATYIKIICLVCVFFTLISSCAQASESIDIDRGIIKIVVNDVKIHPDSFLYNGRTYVSLRDFAEALGFYVSYDARTNTAKITDRQTGLLMNKEIAFIVNGCSPVRVNFFTQLLNWYRLNSGIEGEMEVSQWKEFKEFVKNEAVSMMITEQQAEDMGISITYPDREAIDEKISIFAQRYGGIDAFVEMLENHGITYDFYYSLQENALLRDKLTDELTAPVTEQDVADYYNKNTMMYKTEKVTCKHILIKTTDDLGYPLSAAVKEDAQIRIKNIYDDIVKGKISFDRAMFDFSEDGGLQFYPEGYTISRGEMDVIFENEVFKLSPGEMSGVFETELGYHIAMVTDRTTVIEDFENVKNSIYNTIRNDRYAKMVEPHIQTAYILVNDAVYNSL